MTNVVVHPLLRPSAIAALVASLLLIGIKLLFVLYPGDFPARGQADAFAWPVISIIIMLGLLGLLAERTLQGCDRFPEPFADRARERRGLLVATSTGVAYGVVTIVRDFWNLGPRNPLAVAEWPHVPWPWSVPFYTFGAVLLEFMLRLGALCLLVWLFHVVLFRRRWLMPTFWITNLIVATYEIQPSLFAAIAAREWSAVALMPLEPLYWTNVFEGWLLFRYGWVSPVVFRLVFYLVWHVIYGGLGPFGVR